MVLKSPESEDIPMEIYKKATANYPRNHTDTFYDLPTEKKFRGCLDKNLNFITDIQVRDPETWKLFVEQFRTHPDDADTGWRGEYWGKMMRGACFVYSYSKDPGLYQVLKATVEDLMSTQDQWGRISTYSVDLEFDGWDLWGRKYVLLGMEYFVEVSGDAELNRRIIDCMRRQADYLLSRIGDPAEGKRTITKLTRHWRGLNSSSILEPIVRLYSLTGEQKYLDFASYIVDCGFTDVQDFISLAYKKELRPYQYPVTKAYEMTSCFMGLLEYYRITGKEKHRTAILNFADCVLEDDFTVIGSAGCTHELFDHSTVRQANPDRGDPRAQETCVTVTLMQFFYQLNLLTGDPKYIDALEISLYNAYLGAINTDNAVDHSAEKTYPDWKIVPMPFDSYSPLTPGHRGNGIGGFMRMAGGNFYGCCVCIASAGIGLAMKTAVLTARNGVVVNLFEKGTVRQTLPNGRIVELDLDTDYPVEGRVAITVHPQEAGAFSILVRNPGWSENTSLCVNGHAICANQGYMDLNREWKDGDVIELCFDMGAKAIFPIPYGTQILMNDVVWAADGMGAGYVVSSVDHEHPSTRHHIAIRRGPLMLAQESRLGYNVDDPVEVAVGPGNRVELGVSADRKAPYPCLFEARVPTKDGGFFTVTDYASAGKLWTDESRMAVWFNTK